MRVRMATDALTPVLHDSEQHRHEQEMPIRKKPTEVYIVNCSAVLRHLVRAKNSALWFRENALLGIAATTLMAGYSALLAPPQPAAVPRLTSQPVSSNDPAASRAQRRDA